MNVEEIKRLLERYNSNIAVVESNMIDIKALEKKIELNGKTYFESIDEIATADVLQANIISDMPRSITNKFSSKTENAAQAIEGLTGGRIYINKCNMKYIERELQRLWEYIEPFEIEIARVDALLHELGEQERFIIENYYKLKLGLIKVAERYCNSYGYIHITTIKQKKKIAIIKMSRASEKKPKAPAC